MSTASARFRNLTAVHADRWGLLLAALFVLILSGSVWIASELAALGVEPAMSGNTGGEQAAAGGAWAIAEAIVAALLIGLILLYNRLPEWAQDTVKAGTALLLGMYLGVLANSLDLFWWVAAVGTAYVGIIKATDAYDVYWLWNNLESIIVAIVLGGLLGVVLPLPFLVAGLIGLTVYDHYFANENDWMFTLGGGMLRAKLPVIVFAFPRLRVDWDAIVTAVDPGETPEDNQIVELFESNEGFGIGMADLMFPAAVAAAVTVAGGGVTLPVYGVVAGVVVAAFRLRWEIVNVGGGAGLPAITTGTLGGYAIALVPAVVLG